MSGRNCFLLTPSRPVRKLNFTATIKKQINVKKILAVINATCAVAKRKPEKIRLAGIRTLTSAITVQRSNQLS